MEPKIKGKTLPYLALTITVTIWGLSAIVSKTAYEEIHPMMLFFLRFAIGTIIVSPLIFVRKDDPKVPKKDLPQLALFSFLLTGLGGGGWVLGLYFTTATRAAIISTLGPILTIFLQGIILKRREKAITYIGAMIALFGASIIVLKPILLGENGSSTGNLTLLGDLLIFLSAFGSSLFSVLESRETENYRPYQKIAFYFIFACIISLPIALYIHADNPQWLVSAGSKAWGGVLYYGIGASAIAYILYQWGTEQTSPLETSLFFYLQPVVTIVAAMVFLKECPSAVEWIGGALVILGVSVSTFLKENMKVKPD